MHLWCTSEASYRYTHACATFREQQKHANSRHTFLVREGEPQSSASSSKKKHQGVRFSKRAAHSTRPQNQHATSINTTGDKYLRMLQQICTPKLSAVADREEVIFMKDGYPAYLWISNSWSGGLVVMVRKAHASVTLDIIVSQECVERRLVCIKKTIATEIPMTKQPNYNWCLSIFAKIVLHFETPRL